MTAAVTQRAPEMWATRHLLYGAAAARGAAIREALQRAVWDTALQLWCTPLAVEGAPPDRPAVLVANHASHADTAVVRHAVGSKRRRRLAVAAADDYFFSTPRRAVAFTLAVGAFPFPRRGEAGLRRAEELLRDGWSVLLYPQGTRNPGSDYRPGVLRLARAGWPVVPVGLAGTATVLPKGRRLPRRASTAIVFGRPLEPSALQGDDALLVVVDAITTAAGRAQALASA